MPRFNLNDLLEKTQTVGECLIWQKAKSSTGYGQIWDGQKVQYAHRIVAQIKYGAPSEGQEVMHSCDVPSCINPKHLSYGTRKENMQDASKKGRLKDRRTALGERNASSKLTFSEVRQLRELRSRGYLLKDLAIQFNISIAAVSKIARKEVRINA